MQFYLNGFRPGDPEFQAPFAQGDLSRPRETTSLPQQVDVLIIGCGPAGLTLAAQLSAFADITTCIVEQKDGPLELGQADGVACRTMEMFNAFGFADRVLREAYWVNETSFWRPADDPGTGIFRAGLVKDTEDGLSEFPHVILNQARVHRFYLDVMRKSASGLVPHYGRRLVDVQTKEASTESEEYPVTATFEPVDGENKGAVETIRARYVVGCDGARSAVRRSIGQVLKGDSANQAWGVMDVLAVTDFPDIRLKSVINSADRGTIVLIPREGGYLVRIYVEMEELGDGERVSSRKITVEDVIATANRVLHPYKLDVKEVAWWSVYEIGQRLCERFDNLGEESGASSAPRVFIAGDACHTHSPKAGQGMNVSMQDAFNLGWKLVAVLQDRSAPELLQTYNDERRSIARELLDFDREWAAMLSGAPKSQAHPQGVDPAQVQEYFVRSGRYTAGTATCYAPSILTAPPTYQELARGFPIGQRFHSAPVVRLADAKPMQLGHIARADARWRVYVFADAAGIETANSRVASLCDFLAQSPASPVRRFTPPDADVDATIDIRIVFQQPRPELEPKHIPDLLLPKKGRYGLRDYEKMFVCSPEPGHDIFDVRGIDRRGCIIVVRPDQYVSNVLPLDAHGELARFFAGFMVECVEARAR